MQDKLFVHYSLVCHHNWNCQSPTSGDIVYLLSVASDMGNTWMEWLNDHAVPFVSVVLCAVVVFGGLDSVLLASLLVFLSCLWLLGQRFMKDAAWHATQHTETMTRLHRRIEDTIRNLDAIHTSSSPTSMILVEDHFFANRSRPCSSGSLPMDLCITNSWCHTLDAGRGKGCTLSGYTVPSRIDGSGHRLSVCGIESLSAAGCGSPPDEYDSLWDRLPGNHESVEWSFLDWQCPPPPKFLVGRYFVQDALLDLSHWNGMSNFVAQVRSQGRKAVRNVAPSHPPPDRMQFAIGMVDVGFAFQTDTVLHSGVSFHHEDRITGRLPCISSAVW